MYTEITSISNTVVKYVRQLKNNSFAKQEKKVIVEGANSIKDIPEKFRIEMLFVTKKFGDFDVNAKQKYLLSDKVMDAISDTATPCGILAVVNCDVEADLDSLPCVVLDGVSDPGNVGTIIRTCVACGIQRLIAINSANVWSSKVVRASMSGCFKIGLIECDSVENAIHMLRGYTVYSLDMQGENIFNMKSYDEKFALVVGNEARGISQKMRERSDNILSIPMTKNIESLNAGVSCSIALYQMTLANNN